MHSIYREREREKSFFTYTITRSVGLFFFSFSSRLSFTNTGRNSEQEAKFEAYILDGGTPNVPDVGD